MYIDLQRPGYRISKPAGWWDEDWRPTHLQRISTCPDFVGYPVACVICTLVTKVDHFSPFSSADDVIKRVFTSSRIYYSFQTPYSLFLSIYVFCGIIYK